jgi:hypothetical protein
MIKMEIMGPDVVVHAYDTSTWEAKVSLGYRM